MWWYGDEAFGIRQGHEGGGLMMGLMSLYKETPESLLSTMWDKVEVCKPERGPSSEPDHSDTVILDF